ncbi:MAG: plasmid pRiA4b ORF-3 family protein [bacterium]|nr:plasmid pRiA4b ORF-3 family protein [bacterium]MDE0670039.1 plasmid pRiA4b ORF-3 family protein [bacterium]MXZ31472.1 plasmid pRiA4b ORF-3 family protein [Acidimicrobiia bacterium]MYB25664.1 plasmid pRiA4b ORF-3 family protein [Acidimicrobiia bacterium]
MPATVHTLKVTLRDVRPPVWRLLEVPSETTLGELSGALVWAMGWEGYHLHVFTADGTAYWPPGNDDWFGGYEDESRHRVGDVMPRSRMTMEWEYDMGDSWSHDIVVQSIAPAGPGATLPRCTDGGGACPPEDCGGAWGYAGLVDALGNAGHSRHGEAVEILGEGYDPSHFRPLERRRG